MDQVTKYIERVEAALDCANNRRTKLTSNQLDGVKGLSGKKIRILLNELVKEDTNYLEVGVFTGSTFINAMYGNKPNSATAIDSFSAKDSWEMDMKVDVQYYGIKIKNGLMLHFLESCEENGVVDFTCVQSDCFDLLPPDKNDLEEINTYLFDAGHTKEDHTKAITYYLNNLSDIFIYIVDDWNTEAVRDGTRAGFEAGFVKVHKEWEIHANTQVVDGQFRYDPDWWNGYYIAVCEKPYGFLYPENNLDEKPIWIKITDTIGEKKDV